MTTKSILKPLIMRMSFLSIGLLSLPVYGAGDIIHHRVDDQPTEQISPVSIEPYVPRMSRRGQVSSDANDARKASAKTPYLSAEEVESSTFDMAGFLHFGANNIIGAGIKIVTGSILTDTPVSHSGLLLRRRSDGALFCGEATGSASEVLKKKFPFFRVTPLDQLVADYGGFVAVEPLSYAAYRAHQARNTTCEGREAALYAGGYTSKTMMGVSDNGECTLIIRVFRYLQVIFLFLLQLNG